MDKRQDFRIIEFANWGSVNNEPGSASAQLAGEGHISFTYFDEIRIHEVEECSLMGAYEEIKKLYQAPCRQNYESRQLIAAFTDVVGQTEGADGFGHTQERIDAFWSAPAEPLLFVTMVNIALGQELEPLLQRARNRLGSEAQYLLYQTFEYNEVVLFYRGRSLEEYTQLVMELCFAKGNRGVLDSITMCCFQETAELMNDLAEIPVSLHLQVGTKDYQKMIRYFKRRGVAAQEIQWLLGRNDVSFWVKDTNLAWLYRLYGDIRDGRLQWLSTFQVVLPISPEGTAGLNSAIPQRKRLKSCENICERVDRLGELYRRVCVEQLRILPDEVFLRMLRNLTSMLQNVCFNQLADDLAICLIQEIDDFLQYLERVLSADGIRYANIGSVQKSINVFFQSVSALISSTVHSTQEFVQIPHCAPPGFEMPPKIMAFYELIIRDIMDLFNDKPGRHYGVMLSPKLVDELEVESLAVKLDKHYDQLLGVSIGERMLYDPKNTIGLFGHEMAHFVGDKIRERKLRRGKILTYFICLLVKMEYDCIIESLCLPVEAEEELDKRWKSYFGGLADLLRRWGETCPRFAAAPAGERGIYLDAICYDVENLPSYIFKEGNPQLIDEIFVPFFSMPEVREIVDIADRLGAGCPPGDGEHQNLADSTRARYRKVCAKELVFRTFSDCTERYRRYLDESKAFTEYAKYLFSEAYADVAMIALFGMNSQEYLRLFARDLERYGYDIDFSDDRLELTRFLAVSWAMSAAPGWTDGLAPDGQEEAGWRGTLQAAVRCSQTHRQSVEANDQEVHRYCREHGLDFTFLMLLCDYLKGCASSLKAHFSHRGKAAKQKQLQMVYRGLDEHATAQACLHMIRQKEAAFLKSRDRKTRR